jgi:WD40 repeat protein
VSLRPLNADDIFISYTRRDASTYAAGLADELTKRGFSCFIDRLGTDPDEELPDSLKRKIRNCSMLVVVGTASAAKRQTIKEEVAEFVSAGRTSVVPIDFGDTVYGADWYRPIVGIAPEPELNPDALDDGNPSPSVISRVEKQFNYRRRDERLRRITRRAIAVLACLLIAIAAAAFVAWQQLRVAAAATATANAETARAAQATRDAQAAQAAAHKATEEANAARADADKQRDEATKQKSIADDATRDATEKARLAEEAARKAQEAAKRADAEQARAEHEQIVAEAHALADRSQAVLRQHPEEVSLAVSLAVESMKKSYAAGLHVAESDSALRESLALFPRLRSVHTSPWYVAALSPDGRYYASIERDKIRVYNSSSETPLSEFSCDCSAGIALSSNPLRLAALTNGGVKIFDIEKDSGGKESGGHLLKLELGTRYGNIALSPGGRYLALAFRKDEDMTSFSKLLVLDTATGRTLKSFDDQQGEAGEEFLEGTSHESNAKAAARNAGASAQSDATEKPAAGVSSRVCGLDMIIEDVAFGSGGDLAVGGWHNASQGSRSKGRVVLWSLPPVRPSAGAEPELTDASFDDCEVISQEKMVMAVAPGADENYFATEQGVWRKIEGRVSYEPVARVPQRLNSVITYEPAKLAFGPDGGSLTLARYGPGDEEELLEVWDTTGHWDVARAYQEKDIEHVGFGPGGRLVVAATHDSPRYEPIRVYRAAAGEEVEGEGFGPSPEDGFALFVSPDAGRFITVNDEEAVAVRDLWAKKKQFVQLGPAVGSPRAAALSRRGEFLAIGGRSSASNATQSIVVYRSDGDTFRESGRLLPGAFASEVPLDEMVAMSVSEDGRIVAAHYREGNANRYSNYIRVFAVDAGHEVTPESVKRLIGPGLMALSPDGRFLAVAAGLGRSYLVDLSNGHALRFLDRAEIDSLAFSPDGRYLGLGSDEGTLYVFETANPKVEIARLKHTGRVTALAFSEDNRYVVTASSGFDRYPYNYELEKGGRPLRVWLLQPSDLLAQAEARLNDLRRLDRNDGRR